MFTIGDLQTRAAWSVIASAAIWTGMCQVAVADPAISVSFVDDRSTQTLALEGRVLVEAVDGGILLEDVQRRLWSITPDRLQSRNEAGHDFTALSAAALGAAIVSELGPGFAVHQTSHYVICSNAPDAYVDWVGSLFERLQRAFLQTWKQAGWELPAPAEPLPALVFRSQTEYAAFALKDAGPEVADKPGYYSIRTNRIVLYDLATTAHGAGATSRDDVESRVAAAPANVATIVHEATHQIAFNCGMHTRYSDTPMWLAEGIAMYCETPDLRTGSGWRTIGKPNLNRLRQYREFTARRRQPGSLRTLIQDEARFRNPETMADAYAEGWALVDYLMRERREDLVVYLQRISAKPQLAWDAAEIRSRDFEEAFGAIDDVETGCVAHVRRLRGR
ncbi:MAG: DUF1570 domain-containing protein [Planctomycetaceae bacterium]